MLTLLINQSVFDEFSSLKIVYTPKLIEYPQILSQKSDNKQNLNFNFILSTDVIPAEKDSFIFLA